MSCASPSVVWRLTLLITILLVSCSFIASIVWFIRTKGLGTRYETFYLSRINITAKGDMNSSLTPSEPDHYKDLIKIEIAMRRVEQNSRRLKEYTKSLLWDNKDKSLWCVLFKDSEKSVARDFMRNKIVNEDYIRTLREQKMGEAVIHLRHHGIHHRRRPDTIPDYIK